MPLPQTIGGGSHGFKVGSLKRRLDAVTVAILDPLTTGTTGTANFQLFLKNLNADLSVHLFGAFSSPDQSGLDPSIIPAGAVTIQLTPRALTPNVGRVYLRPVFQDPTAAQNENHPLPQDLPFGWEFTTNADEVRVDLTVDLGLFDGSENGQIIVGCDVEYDGAWWDTEAYRYAISQVQLTKPGVLIIGTGLS